MDITEQTCFFGNCALVDRGELADRGGPDWVRGNQGFSYGANMAGIINDVLARDGSQDRILGFTTDSASNNRTLTADLNNAWSLGSVEWCEVENHIPCMAHVIQLILGAFMSSIKVESQDGHMPSGLKSGYIEKVMRWDNSFHKTVEKVMCLRSYT